MGVTLIRHTKLKAADGVCYGRTDLDVADTFEEEAALVIEQAPAADAIISSPLTRCQKLAHQIAAALSIDVTLDPRLQEMNFGAWEGRRWSEIPQVELDAWAADFLHARPHKGESVAMLRERTMTALAEYGACDQSHILVTHAGVIKAALSDGDSADNFSIHVEFGGVVKLPNTIIRSAP